MKRLPLPGVADGSPGMEEGVVDRGGPEEAHVVVAPLLVTPAIGMELGRPPVFEEPVVVVGLHRVGVRHEELVVVAGSHRAVVVAAATSGRVEPPGRGGAGRRGPAEGVAAAGHARHQTLPNRHLSIACVLDMERRG